MPQPLWMIGSIVGLSALALGLFVALAVVVAHFV